MIYLVLSSFLFGLSNPLAALLVEDADALIFAFHFLLMLTLIQLPFVLGRMKEVKKLKMKGEFDLLIISGLIGTFLYWCEFSSLQVGLPISHVTFLLLTVPAWTLLWEWLRGRGTKTNLNKWAIALLGSVILISPNESGQFSMGYLLPIFTSLLTAMWLIYSKKAQEAGIHPIVCSFFNDLFSLIGVLGF
ncbi:MAG: EamA family transporter, partial [Bdellovibrionales bacterium]|nr:EamA family transporter [Bdellovibrionales bacterium]